MSPSLPPLLTKHSYCPRPAWLPNKDQVAKAKPRQNRIPGSGLSPPAAAGSCRKGTGVEGCCLGDAQDPRGRASVGGFQASDETQVYQERGSSRLGLKFACVLAYTDLVREKQIKSAAWFLLLLLVLDLSTAGICSAGTFPGFHVQSDTTLRGGSTLADSQAA